MITSARIADTPPFTDPVEFVFDEYVNLFIGPNASGKSTILRRLRPGTSDDKFNLELRSMSPDERQRLAEYRHPIPWVFIPSSRMIIPFSDRTPDWLSELPDDMPSDFYQLLRRNTHPHAFDGRLVYLATEAILHELSMNQGDASKFENVLKSKNLPYMCAQDICRDVLLENEQRDYIQRIPYPVNRSCNDLWSPEIDESTTFVDRDTGREMAIETFVHYGMGVGTIDVKDNDDGMLYVGDLSSGTQGTLLWIWYLALRMAHHYDFADGWEEKPAALLIDEIENHLHPTWQRRVIPALRKHFPGVQIFATTHSPFVVAGLKAGQIHLLQRDENGIVSASTNERDIIGWTISEILRALMGVDDPTDEPTAINAARLRELRSKRASEEGLSDAEEAEMRDLRKSVSRDMLAKGALNAQRDRLADTLQEFMQSRLAKTPDEQQKE